LVQAVLDVGGDVDHGSRIARLILATDGVPWSYVKAAMHVEREKFFPIWASAITASVFR
jgi:hypothetical protein